MSSFLYPLASTVLVGCCGVLPFFPYKYILKNSSNNEFASLKVLAMYFATGCLISEIFIHLLPEIWRIALSQDSLKEQSLMSITQLCLAGFITFLLGDKLFSLFMSSGTDNTENFRSIGYLNVFANIMDNFVHALSITSSYSQGVRNGIITTVVITIHEIPHEIGDFSILLQSGFSLTTALKLQLLTGIGGIAGVTVGLVSQGLTENSPIILSSITGGFLYIVCASCLPEILNESVKSRSQYFTSEIFLFLFGTLITALISVYC